jgi:hypothetical protein
MPYTADFETTTLEDDCRVWAFGVCDISNPEFFIYGTTIDDFIEYCKESINETFYFHNLKFDGMFILSEVLMNQGYKHVINKKDVQSNTFTTLISDKGQFYSIKLYFEVNGSEKHFVTFYDSMKIIPFSVKEIAKAFNLPIHKEEIDYNYYRPIGHKLTEQEKNYLHNDVEIPARALKTLFDQGLTKMTQGSNALFDYKRTIGNKNFEKWFPIPWYDADLRTSYKGGYTYLNPVYKGVILGRGFVLDINSLYPSVMHDRPLPYGEGIHFDGQYESDKLYSLYIQRFTCNFEIKEGYLPTIQIKKFPEKFVETEYLTSSNGEDVTLTLTNIDLELFFEHYNVYNIVYHSGWKFKSTTGLFTKYIDKWTAIKIQATKDGNNGMRTLAKLMLNALYGKFALNPNVRSKIPYLTDTNIVKFNYGEKETREPIYLPVGTFVTSWARYVTITSAQKIHTDYLNGKSDIDFAYADTDSLHCVSPSGLLPEGLEIDDTTLGKWKHENDFTQAKFLRQKTYLEEIPVDEKEYIKLTENKKATYIKDGQYYFLNITVAGMPDRCYTGVTWDNFSEGQAYAGKLRPKTVVGGVILIEEEFTIKPSRVLTK